MSKKKDKNEAANQYQVIRKIRGDWGVTNPVTKVIPNKKKNKKEKYPHKVLDND